MRFAKANRVLGLLTCVLAPSAAWLRGQALLDRVTLEVEGIADSGQYFVYAYRLANSQASRAGVAALALDLTASPGAGRVALPATGRFVHGAS